MAYYYFSWVHICNIQMLGVYRSKAGRSAFIPRVSLNAFTQLFKNKVPSSELSETQLRTTFYSPSSMK